MVENSVSARLTVLAFGFVCGTSRDCVRVKQRFGAPAVWVGNYASMTAKTGHRFDVLVICREPRTEKERAWLEDVELGLRPFGISVTLG